jgi:hypothetical protein
MLLEDGEDVLEEIELLVAYPFGTTTAFAQKANERDGRASSGKWQQCGRSWLTVCDRLFNFL